MTPLIFGNRISGAAAWSAADGVDRLAGALLCSVKTTEPAAEGVHVVSPSGIVTLRSPDSVVPVRAGSSPPVGLVTLEYTWTFEPSAALAVTKNVVVTAAGLEAVWDA